MKINRFIAASILGTALLSAAALADPAPASLPTPNAVVYVQQLPSPADLTKSAAAQGLTVSQISQTANQITVVYTTPNGQTNTVAYQPLSAISGTAPAGSQAVAVPATAAPSTTVVYSTPVYYDPYPYGYPYWGWYPPVAVSLGFGFHGGWHGGGHWR